MNIRKTLNKYKVWIFLAIAVLVVVSIIKTPVFFDNFGIVIFGYLFGLGFYMAGKKFPNWMVYSLLAIGGAGLIVDFINILK